MESSIQRVKVKRNTNYTHKETEKLLSLVKPKINIIEIKKTDAFNNNAKYQAWKEIEEDFNRARDGTVYRDARQLKMKYESIKGFVKKKSRQMSDDLTPIERRVKEMMESTLGRNESFLDLDPLGKFYMLFYYNVKLKR